MRTAARARHGFVGDCRVRVGAGGRRSLGREARCSGDPAAVVIRAEVGAGGDPLEVGRVLASLGQARLVALAEPLDRKLVPRRVHDRVSFPTAMVAIGQPGRLLLGSEPSIAVRGDEVALPPDAVAILELRP